MPAPTENQAAAIKTPATSADVLGAMQRAYATVVGAPPPSPSSYVIPAAQSALETARWKSLYNYNLGNITHVPGDGFDWMYEYTGSLRFRSYDSLDAGAVDMMKLLQKDGVLPFADAGDVTGYVAQLAARCYVGCVRPGYNPYPAYEKGIRSIAAELSGKAPGPPKPPKAPGGVAPWAVGLAALGLGALVLRRR